MKSKRITSIDILRGLAAFLVTMYHLSNGNSKFLSDENLLKIVFRIGWVGVEIFFIISGFIIPYSMMLGNYTMKSGGRFLWKRICRIDPPYIASIIFILFLNFISTLSPYYKGKPFSLNIHDVLYHLGYLSGVLEKPWINVVYWTLAIEFQYYILIAFIFPFLSSNKVWLFLTTIVGLGILKFLIVQEFFVFKYLLYFLIGIVLFKKVTNQITFSVSIPIMICLLGLILWQEGILPMLASAFTLLFILFGNNITIKPFAFLGTLSYSLYLLHVPIGGRVINLSTNFVHGEIARTTIVLIALIVSLIISYGFYLIIEKRFILLSSKIKLT